MKFSLFPNYGAINSKPVFEAFAQGIQRLGHEVVYHDTDADFFVIWSVLWQGRMRLNQEIWNFAKNHKKSVIVLEVGTLIRGETWKVGTNHINANGFNFNNNFIDKERSKKLGIFLKPWNQPGKNVIIFGQHSQSEQWRSRPPIADWLQKIIFEVRQYTQRQIIFRPHPRDRYFQKTQLFQDIIISTPRKIPNSHEVYNHEQEFNSAWCVINACSGTGVQAAINGIPVFVEKDSLAWPVSMQSLENIEKPLMPDRTLWLEHICNTEWTIDEISSGVPLEQFVIKG